MNQEPHNSTAALLINAKSDPAEVAPVRHQIEAFCRQAEFEAKAAEEIGLCVNEALANVIFHAYRGESGHPIEVTATLCEGNLAITIRDWGTGVTPGPGPAMKFDPLQPGGLGLICLGRLMDRVTFVPQRPVGMLLEMIRHR